MSRTLSPDVAKALLDMTVSEAVSRHPSTIEVFSRHGIGTCCGGPLAVSVAAYYHRVDPAVLVDELARGIEQEETA